MPVAFRLQDIEDKKANRDPAYVRAIMYKGTIDGDLLFIQPEDLRAIWLRYYPERIKEIPGCSCAMPPKPPQVQRPKTDPLKENLEKEGIQWGDAVAWVTKKLGIPKCSSCAVRQQIMNDASKLGWKEALKQIKDTL